LILIHIGGLFDFKRYQIQRELELRHICQSQNALAADLQGQCAAVANIQLMKRRYDSYSLILISFPWLCSSEFASQAIGARTGSS
jgi:hypothetical protein